MSILSPYKGYQAKVEYSEEDKLIIGEVVGIRDSLNFHAEKAEEVESMFHQCVDNYLAFCAEIGVNPDKTYSGTFNVRIGAELHRIAEQEAIKREISLNQLVVQALENEVKGYHGAMYTIMLPTQMISGYQTEEGKKSSAVMKYPQAKRSLTL